MTTKGIVAIVTAVALAVAAGCGGSDESPDKTRADRAIQATPQRRAESMVLQLGDLPGEWRASPQQRDRSSEDLLRSCLGVDYSELTVTGEAFSRNFTAEHTQASSKATVFTGPEQAHDAFSKLSEGMESGAAEGCFRRQIETINMLDVGDVVVAERPFRAPSTLDESRGWQIVVSFQLSRDAPPTTAYLELLMVRRGAAVSTLNATDAAGPIAGELRSELVRAIARRMSALRRE